MTSGLRYQVEHHKVERSNLKNVSHFRELSIKTQRILLRSLTFQSVQSIVSPALEVVDVRIDKLEGGQGHPVQRVGDAGLRSGAVMFNSQ